MEAHQQAKRLPWVARTHAKILIGPLVVQALMITAHIMVGDYAHDMDTGFEAVDRWTPIVLHSIIGLISLAYVVLPALRWIRNKFVITEDRVMMYWGLFEQQDRSIQISNITQMNTRRSLFDRLFGCGTIILTDASASGKVKLVDVPRVKKARKLIEELQNAA